MKLRVAIAGASGLIGTALRQHLADNGHTAVPLVRGRPAEDNEIAWKPATQEIEKNKLEGVDAVVNLSGESLAGTRWSDASKKRFVASRVDSTKLLAESIAGLETPPRVMISGSAIGYYGNRGDETLTESSAQGDGFLAELCGAWEDAAAPAVGKTRIVHSRIGIVLTKKGGALAKMLPPFKMGVGGPLGSGEQWMSWISIDDIVRAFVFCIENDTIEGPINFVGSQPLRNKAFSKTLASALHRPSFFPAPKFALKIAFGEMADEALLASQRVEPKALIDAGFSFHHPTFEQALDAVL